MPKKKDDKKKTSVGKSTKEAGLTGAVARRTRKRIRKRLAKRGLTAKSEKGKALASRVAGRTALRAASRSTRKTSTSSARTGTGRKGTGTKVDMTAKVAPKSTITPVTKKKKTPVGCTVRSGGGSVGSMRGRGRRY